MKCEDQLQDILSRLDKQSESIQERVEIWNDCLVILKQMEPECSCAFVQTAQEILRQNNPLYVQDERKLQLILWAISKNNKSTAIELASAALNSDKTGDKEEYVDILDNLNDPRTIPALMSALELDHSVGKLGGMARAKAINTLLLFNAQEAKYLIMLCVKDSVYRVRKAAIRFLLELDIAEAAPVFIEQLKEEDDPDNLECLIDGIICWEQTKALPALRDILSSEWVHNDEYLREIVEDAISELQAIEKPATTS